MDKLEVKIENSANGVVIREGKAPDLLPAREPKIISISGDIHSISNFLTKRGEDSEGYGSQLVDKSKVIVEVDKNVGHIVLRLDPEDYYGMTITATLLESEELKPFCINGAKKFTRDQLKTLIKFSRLFFDDKDQHQKLMDSLSKLRMKTESEMKQENDNRGNKVNSFERKVIDDSGFAQFFTLHIPIFKGFDAINVQVEICFEPSESGILFWLESPELVELTQSQVDAIFDKELESCAEFVVIHK